MTILLRTLVAVLVGFAAIQLGTLHAATAQPLAIATQPVPPTLISMGGGRVADSSTFQSQIIGSTFPHGLAGYRIRVSTTDPLIAVAFQFLTPDFGLTQATSTATSVSMAVVDLNGLVEVGAVDVVLGTITFLGRNPGITSFTIEVLRMDDETGAPILTSTEVGLLTVSHSKDLDGDGTTEDINGNGFFDFADILELFRMLLREEQ